MILATYIDGNERTSYGALLTRHSVSVKVQIAKEHEADWLNMLSYALEDGEKIEFPKDRSKPVPFTISTDNLADYVDDCAEEDFVKPYYSELEYMCEKDTAGMGIVYLLGNLA